LTISISGYLEDGTGWTVIDMGICTKGLGKSWQQVIEQHLNNKPINRVIVTRLHPAHIGLAGWLTERFDSDLWISLKEFQFSVWCQCNFRRKS